MLFNSIPYFFFFVIITLLYFNVPQRLRWLLLLLGSCYFYISFIPVYIIILGALIVISYFAGILIEKNPDKKKRFHVTLGIVTVTFILAFFKYFHFLVQLFDKSHFYNPAIVPLYMKILLPVGLSFHTFQVISYMIEVHRGNQKAETNFGIFALYVMYFPQLIAGPIERPGNLIHQFYEKHNFDLEKFKSGAMLMAFGLFKKVVIADRFGIAVDGTYGNIPAQTGSALLVSTLLYAFQLYCDFSGYTDIAIGSARIMGFKLSDNFRMPYFAKSISDFWTRWHISLSTWLRDYLFLPVAYKMLRVVKKPTLRIKPEIWSYCIATIVTMFIAGMWHGENWTFLIWGLLHGIFLVVSFIKGRVYKKYRMKIKNKGITPYIRTVLTFLVVSSAWVFFRASDFSSAIGVFGKIFSTSLFKMPSFALNNAEMFFCFILIVILLVKERFFEVINTSNTLGFSVKIFMILILCYFFGVFGQRQFIYFQF